MKLIIIRGQMNAGKTTTCGMVYSELLDSMPKKEHWFKHRTVSTNSLQYNPEGSLIDFKAILTIKGKKVGIISAGDIADDLKRDINLMIKLEVEILVCCTRSQNRRGSSYRMMERDIRPHHETLAVRKLEFSEDRGVKQQRGEAMRAEVVRLVNQEIENG